MSEGKAVVVAFILACLVALGGFASNLLWDNPPSGTEIIQPTNEGTP